MPKTKADLILEQQEEILARLDEIDETIDSFGEGIEEDLETIKAGLAGGDEEAENAD